MSACHQLSSGNTVHVVPGKTVPDCAGAAIAVIEIQKAPARQAAALCELTLLGTGWSLLGGKAAPIGVLPLHIAIPVLSSGEEMWPNLNETPRRAHGLRLDRGAAGRRQSPAVGFRCGVIFIIVLTFSHLTQSARGSLFWPSAAAWRWRLRHGGVHPMQYRVAWARCWGCSWR